MKFLEKHPMIMIAVGIAGISLSAIFVKYSQAPSVVTAAYRLLWTVGLMTPMVFGKGEFRRELLSTEKREVLLCAVSGIFLALHFTVWFESLNQTSVASSTAISCTEVIWVALGYCLFLKGRISAKAGMSILITVAGSLVIALSDYSAGGNHFYGDVLALGAAIFQAVYTLIGRQARRNIHHGLYIHRIYLLLSFPVWGCGSSGLILYRLRSGKCGSGLSPKRVLHPSGTQHFQLVPEIPVPGLCVSLKAL